MACLYYRTLLVGLAAAPLVTACGVASQGGCTCFSLEVLARGEFAIEGALKGMRFWCAGLVWGTRTQRALKDIAALEGVNRCKGILLPVLTSRPGRL